MYRDEWSSGLLFKIFEIYPQSTKNIVHCAITSILLFRSFCFGLLKTVCIVLFYLTNGLRWPSIKRTWLSWNFIHELQYCCVQLIDVRHTVPQQTPLLQDHAILSTLCNWRVADIKEEWEIFLQWYKSVMWRRANHPWNQKLDEIASTLNIFLSFATAFGFSVWSKWSEGNWCGVTFAT